MFNLEINSKDGSGNPCSWIYVSISKKASPLLVKEVIERLKCLRNVIIATYDSKQKYDESSLTVIDYCIVVPPPATSLSAKQQTHVLGRGVFSEIEFFRNQNTPVYVVSGIKRGLIVNEIDAIVQKPNPSDWNHWGYIRVNRTEKDLVEYNFTYATTYCSVKWLSQESTSDKDDFPWTNVMESAQRVPVKASDQSPGESKSELSHLALLKPFI